MFTRLYATALVISAACAASIGHHHEHDHKHSTRQALPRAWHQRSDHPAYTLFRRDPPPGDGISYAEVGSPEWAAGYPQGIPDPTKMPQAWIDALAAAEAANVIPNFAPTTLNAAGVPVYAAGVDPMSPEICSGTVKCRNPADFWDAPDGYMGAGFDDGPYNGSPLLYSFLQANNIHSTHFMIGEYILQNPNGFMEAFETMGDDIAVHTWSHRYMTSLTNAEVVAELGWTMEIIHNSTYGRLPRFWRPPMGDSDERVRAIALYIFGLETIFWNQDTEDWTLGLPNGTTPAVINASMTTWLDGPKSPGLIILEHELTNASAQCFINAYPDIVSNGWKLESVATLVSNGNTYQNAQNSGSPVTPAPNGIFNVSLLPAQLVAPSTFSAPASSSANNKVDTAPTQTNTASGNSASQGSTAKSSAASLLHGVNTITIFSLVSSILLGLL